MTVLVTGGAGFIGSAVIRNLILNHGEQVVNVDKLTYAGNLASLEAVQEDARYSFERADICDAERLERIFSRHAPTSVLHLAAESHVDRSIDRPEDFIQTNIVGAYTLLEIARRYFEALPAPGKEAFRFVHVSTDEVFGALGPTGVFSEDSPYRPNSPYAASKAASDHLVRAWHRTYGLPTIVTNCSNNYGPYQYPEKLIPVMILNALNGKPLPVYGAGENKRDWLYVDDHAQALAMVLSRGRVGETYAIGSDNEHRNIDLVREVCAILDELLPDSPHVPHRSLIVFVPDRLGHDFRYAIDASKVETELGWRPAYTFDAGLLKTVEWYLANLDWSLDVLASGDANARQETLR